MSVPTFYDRLKQKISRVVEPIAHGLLDWSQAFETRVGIVEARVGAVEVEKDRLLWGREALVERLNRAETREEALSVRLTALETSMEQNHWSREALVERLNFVDARDEARGKSLDLHHEDMRSLQRFVVEQGCPIDATQLDAIALVHRLAALEDHVEALLLRHEAQGRETDRPEIVSFSLPTEAEREKEIG